MKMQKAVPINKQITKLIAVAKVFYDKNWLLGTSGNLSALSSRKPLRFFVTASGTEKDALKSKSFIEAESVNGKVKARRNNGVDKISGESILHAVIYKNTSAGAIIHTHSALALAVADLFSKNKSFRFGGYEVQKGLGFKKINTGCVIPIFKNINDLTVLSKSVIKNIKKNQIGFLIKKHGLFAWGTTIEDAKRHTELLHHVFEFKLLKHKY